MTPAEQYRRTDDTTKRIERIVISRPIDEDPDLSWLEQTDAQMGAGFEEQSRARLADYGDGWIMVAVVATAHISVCGARQTIQSGGLWGIESDSDESYFAEIGADEVQELRETLLELGFTAEQIDNVETETTR